MSITVRGLISQGAREVLTLAEEKPPAIVRKRLSGELFGLTCAGCDLRKEGVTVNVTQESNPNNRGLSILRLGLSHLTVIRTHILWITSFPVLS